MIPALALSLLLSWVQVRSDTFIVKSSAGEQRAQRVLRELENFHQLLGTFVFKTSQLPELPMEVLLVGDQETLDELAPEYDGKKTQLAAYYQPGQDRDFIVLNGRAFPQTLDSIVYHEITHYFLSRALVHRSTWLNEGMAEYFAMADIDENEVYLGQISPERLQVLRNAKLLSLKEFFAVDRDSMYYNERQKANVFYAQAWAFVHFLMHGRHSLSFKLYLEELTRSEPEILDYLNVSERELESEFLIYLSSFMKRTGRTEIKVSRDAWTMKTSAIPDAEAHMTVSEILLASGDLAGALRHLEAVSELEQQYPRASYYRGVLARLGQNRDDARDFFVDALGDSQLAARAAIQLVQMGELQIPAVRATLIQASSSGTRMPDVYWALSELYLDDLRDIEESIRLERKAAIGPPAVRSGVANQPPAEPVLAQYSDGNEPNIRYRLLAESNAGPRLQRFVSPYYPGELLAQKLAGEVVIDVQLTAEGDVAGMWLVSAMPDIFGNLATAAVREWKFEPAPAKIRVVVAFFP